MKYSYVYIGVDKQCQTKISMPFKLIIAHYHYVRKRKPLILPFDSIYITFILIPGASANLIQTRRWTAVNSRGIQIAHNAKTHKNCTREIYGWIFVYRMPEYRLTWNHCIAMRHELHFAENMHFVWEAVKLFENSICVVHTPILKMWRLMHSTFKLKQPLYYLQNSYEFKFKLVYILYSMQVFHELASE